MPTHFYRPSSLKSHAPGLPALCSVAPPGSACSVPAHHCPSLCSLAVIRKLSFADRVRDLSIAVRDRDLSARDGLISAEDRVLRCATRVCLLRARAPLAKVVCVGRDPRA
ncbi:hypothetical protein PR003_g22995 [Phytophthora rubi]|uniref:Uncharacterized protein n=1 Tax=Phytophthora rubi TaxID=129364 RepID=A0A6A4D0L8_9STRA|nr:hypothetical protein PR002_g22098 [Phytophthora rubi]KAE9299441.1 hypothetical protein PR003_g22995 [Phytophthora rubi]